MPRKREEKIVVATYFMRDLIGRSAVKLGAILVSTAALSFAASAQQLLWEISDMNSLAKINVGDASRPLGMYNWLVNGQNQLRQQWFWYRTDPGVNAALNNLGPAVVTQPAANQLNSLFSNGQVSVGVNYTLSGGTVPDIQESIQIKNLSTAPVSFHFFQFSNFDLGASSGADAVGLSTSPLTGRFSGAEQIKSTISLNESIISDTSVAPFANIGEAGDAGTLLNKISNGAYNLDPNNVLYTGDAAWAFQWDFTLNPGAIINISKDKTIQGVPVPEPVTAALMGLGLAVLSLRRRFGS
jgi:hypothetical protein